MGDWGPDDSYHYPTALLALLQGCIPLLCPAKKDVFQFFRAAGVERRYYSYLESRWREDAQSVGKHLIAREVLKRLNETKTDDALRQRREIIKRVTTWEQFSTLWPDDQLKARGLVAEVQQLVNVSDSFSRMKEERERELQTKRDAQRKQAEAERKNARAARR